uniref:Serine/threonine-protein kinase svkA n=2 Tax=Anthurium amnicola TaxID=1678845 RepID=A0A1D1YUD4_9ARAE
MAKGEPPLADLHPMRVLFIIPRENPPQLDEHFSRAMKEFVSLCLKKLPLERPSAKELLKLRFIRNARRSLKLLERIRERPKFQIKEHMETQRSGNNKASDDTPVTVKINKPPREEIAHSSQTLLRNAGWDFSIGGSQGTGTVHSSVKLPDASVLGERKSDVSYNLVPIKVAPDRGENQWIPSPGYAYHDSSSETLLQKLAESDYNKRRENSFADDHISVSDTGTVVVRSPNAQIYTSFNHQSPMFISRYTSSEDMSASGTVVIRGQPDESHTPRASKSRLGTQEKTSTSSHEDSVTNLAEAKAKLEGAGRKGFRENSAMGKSVKEIESKITEMMSDSDFSRNPRQYSDGQKMLQKSHQIGDIDGASRAPASPALSFLIIPSLKEVAGDAAEGSATQSMVGSLMNLECQKPGFCEAFVRNLLQRLGSSNEPSMEDLQDLSSRIFMRSRVAEKEVGDDKKQLRADVHEASGLSPLARFLLTRWQGQASQDLNSV